MLNKIQNSLGSKDQKEVLQKIKEVSDFISLLEKGRAELKLLATSLNEIKMGDKVEVKTKNSTETLYVDIVYSNNDGVIKYEFKKVKKDGYASQHGCYIWDSSITSIKKVD